ncbi:hypothetical protein BCR44DRAFT_23414 [Catenaria anguillulae PL171]|uniref:Uncharacterized protein n=1 Tax=Catenaria anguillulae PL171 TaxID=765915 RepID=A0A1Y2H7L7_9FUNG|nr:hypothetical protein BCR44DRAFT_23414 [Catenaria anguillulae PL171]
MVNVISKRCQFDGCTKRPAFNTKGSTKARFCAQHKTPEMVNVKSKRCQFDECTKIPAFNTEGSNQRRFCAQHKTPEMVDVKNKRCQFDGCTKQPIFNTEGSSKARFCAQHKTPEMVDVKSKQCQFDGCQTRASYGLPGHQAEHCFTHRQVNEVSKPRKKCIESGCNQLATHGILRHEHCEKHVQEGELNMFERPCLMCNLPSILVRNNHCEYCDPEAFQSSRLAKQNAVRDFLLAHGITFESVDRVIDGGACGLERPDFVIQGAYQIIIVECDENQHFHISKDCETVREINISQSFGGTPVLFLRFNPDEFKRPKGTCEIGTSERLRVLLQVIKHHLPEEPSHFLRRMYLYYDGFTNKNLVPETIDMQYGVKE